MKKSTKGQVVEQKKPYVITKSEVLKHIVREMENDVSRYRSQYDKFMKYPPNGLDLNFHNAVKSSEEIIHAEFITRWVKSVEISAESNKIGLITALRAWVDELSGQLLRDSYRAASTSALHNAVEGIERAAAARFVAEYRRLLREYDRATDAPLEV
jgi:hypothetical protein